MIFRTVRPFGYVIVLSLSVLAGCRSKEPAAPPMATATVQLSRSKAPLGSPIDISYKFVVANDAKFTDDNNVMLHVVDTDNELLFTLDHVPPTPTSQWKPGQTIEYTRTEFIPVYPYVGEAIVEVGLYSVQNGKRQPLAGGEDAGQRAYRVAKLTLQPQTENVYVVFKDGWHPAEVAEKNAAVEWQWTKRVGTLAFKNPKKDCILYLDVDHPTGVFADPQQVDVTVGGQPVDHFTLNAGDRTLKKIALKAAQFGSEDTVEMQIAVDKTYVPATMNVGNKDPRELGVRVFHAFIQPAN
jgi:hypothetical protein